MHDLVYFQNKLLTASEAEIPAISNINLYGKGVFTTIAIYDSTPFLFERHWSRLCSNAQKLGLDLKRFDEQTLFESLMEVIEKNGVSNGKCRITFFDESVSRIWKEGDDGKVGLLIQTAELGEIKQYISLTVSPFTINSISPLAGVKSCNYLESILANEDARSKGFDEAIRSNEREEITSACMANVFWEKDEKLYTPSLKTGCLAGTTRGFILERFKVSQVEAGIEVLQDADRVFLTSAGIGIAQIGNLDEKEFTRELHDLTRVISEHQP